MVFYGRMLDEEEKPSFKLSKPVIVVYDDDSDMEAKVIPNATRSLLLSLDCWHDVIPASDPQSVLDASTCAYNILPTAGSSVGFKHTDEANEMKGREHSDETKSRISATKKGHSTSEETKSKISISKKGQKHSDEMKAKMSDAHLREKNGRFNKGRGPANHWGLNE